MTEQTHKTIGIAVVEYQGRFLVGIRPPGASLAGFAEFPGGKCEEAEAPAAAAVRECWEETGLEIAIRELLMQRRYEYYHGSVDLNFFLCHPTGDPTQHTDLRGFQWTDLETLRRMKFPDANLPVLRMLEQRLRPTDRGAGFQPAGQEPI